MITKKDKHDDRQELARRTAAAEEHADFIASLNNVGRSGMPRMSGQAVAVAANTVSANQVAGQLYEFINRPSKLVLACTSSAVGINVTMLVGSVALINDQPISQANRYPIIPDDIALAIKGAAGRLVLTFRNTTAGALTVNWTLDVG